MPSMDSNLALLATAVTRFKVLLFGVPHNGLLCYRSASWAHFGCPCVTPLKAQQTESNLRSSSP